MTRRNMSWNSEEPSSARPFLLKPAGKDYLWGGSRLKDDFSKDMDLTPLAETWECSTHPDGPSIVASGVYEGRLLSEVLNRHPEYMGTHPKTDGGLPILIKFIDARKDLSVQVHPDDEYAREHEHGSLGKTEMWYVLDAAKDAKLVYGFYHDISREKLKKSLEDGTVERYLQKVKVQKDDLFYIEPGTVHAIGAGTLPAGQFVMGSYRGQSDTRPTAKVKIDKAFWMGELEVTNQQFNVIFPDHDSRFVDQQWKDHVVQGYPANKPEQPVIRVSYNDAINYCKKLSEKTGLNITLPTEAQWEWACRAGSDQDFWYGDMNADFGKKDNLADVTTLLLAVSGIDPQPMPKTSYWYKYYTYLPKEEGVDDGNLVQVPAGMSASFVTA